MEKHEITVKFIRESDTQILVDYLSKRIWLPMDEIGYINGDSEKGEIITISVPHRLARLKGIV
jgi:hypothetical protein